MLKYNMFWIIIPLFEGLLGRTSMFWNANMKLIKFASLKIRTREEQQGLKVYVNVPWLVYIVQSFNEQSLSFSKVKLWEAF